MTVTEHLGRGNYWYRCGLLLLCLMTVTLLPQIVVSKSFELILLHTNDMHSRFKQIDQFGGDCSDKSAKAKQCYGGFARVHAAVKKLRNEAKSKNIGVLYLDSGNSFQGTKFYMHHKATGMITVMNKLKPDVISLGIHEFDDGLENIGKFIHDVKVPIVCSNIDVSQEPLLSDKENLRKSHIVNVNGRSIGIIGYLTTEARFHKHFSNIKISSEIEEIKEQAKKLKEQGVNIIIALGQSGFNMDQEIAETLTDVDIVIGGHSRTFLYNENGPDIEQTTNPYPFWMNQPFTRRKVPIVQAYLYTKYLGQLSVTFNKNGDVIKAEGNPMLLDYKIEQDPELLEIINKLEIPFKNEINDVIGSTSVFLQGGDNYCGQGECNFGNHIVDAFIDYNIRQHADSFPLDHWTDASIAIIENSVIESNISPMNRNGAITMGDILMVLPYQNDVGKMKVTGWDLYRIIAHGAINYKDKEYHGEFVQVSGIKVVIDLTVNTSFNVHSVYVRCAQCSVPIYEKLVYERIYTIIVNERIAKGRNGFVFEKVTGEYKSLGITETEILWNDMTIIKSPIQPENSGRIIMIRSTDDKPEGEEALTFSPEAEDTGVMASFGETLLDIAF